MKNRLITLAAALTLAAVLGSIYAAPALAAVIKAALVKNVDEAGRDSFFREGSAVAGNVTFLVPMGKVLVVDHFSSMAKWATPCECSPFLNNTITETPAGGGAPKIRIFTARPLDAGRLLFPTAGAESPAAAAEEEVHWYFRPGSSVVINASAGPSTEHFSMEGHFIDEVN